MGGGGCGPVRMEPFVLLVFFPPVLVKFEANPCDGPNGDLVVSSLVLWAFGLFWALGTQIHRLSFSTPTNTIKSEKKRQNDKWLYFHACKGGRVSWCVFGFPLP